MSLYWLILVVPVCVAVGLLLGGALAASKEGDLRMDAVRAYSKGVEAGKRQASR